MEWVINLFRSLRALLRFLHIIFVVSRELVYYLFKPNGLGKRLRRVLQKLGPTFVKFGQILSTRRDLLPEPVIKELENLQSNVEPFSDKQAKAIIEKSFKKPITQVFKQFKTPRIAAASLGQVYRAFTKEGDQVAVKVQRPGAKKIIKVDTLVLSWLTKLAESLFPPLRIYRLQDAVKEFRRWTLNEINYALEAANADIFNQYFKNDPHVYSPKVYWRYTKKNVLTLEFIDGQNLAEIIKIKGQEKRKQKIARYGADSFMRQYFEFGFFHADPHPGNIFVNEDDILYFLDFGMVGRLDPHLTELVSGVFLALLQKDTAKIVDLMVLIHEEYADARQGGLSQSEINLFRRRGAEIVEQWFGVTNKEHNFTLIFYEILTAAALNGFFVPVDVILMAKSIVTLDVVTRGLDPDFNLEKLEEPLIRRLIAKRLDLEKISKNIYNTGEVMEKMIAALPSYQTQLAKSLIKGRIGMDISPQNLAEYESRLEQASEGRTLAIVVGALFLGSAWLNQLIGEPSWLGVRLSLFGFFLSFVLLLKVLFILKKGEQGYEH